MVGKGIVAVAAAHGNFFAAAFVLPHFTVNQQIVSCAARDCSFIATVFNLIGTRAAVRRDFVAVGHDVIVTSFA